MTMNKTPKISVERSANVGMPALNQTLPGTCQLVNLPKINDSRGNLTFIEANRHAWFDIKRAYYLYDVPKGTERGGHGHKELHQLIIAVAGSFDVVLDDGRERRRIHLSLPNYGIYVCPMIWREVKNFAAGSVCLVLASDIYKESDYLHEYEDYLKAVRSKA
jgi:hypothetical protein